MTVGDFMRINEEDKTIWLRFEDGTFEMISLSNMRKHSQLFVDQIHEDVFSEIVLSVKKGV